LTRTEELLIDHTEKALHTALEKVNQFYQAEWPTLREEVESVELTGFKPVEIFTLK